MDTQPNEDEDETETSFTPDEMFALIGNETRFTILETLWDAPGYELSFSELRAAVGLRESGGFNYHLDKLLDRFVVPTNDGYQLNFAGARVIGTVLSGRYAQGTPRGPVELTATCDRCNAPLQVSYRAERGRVECSDCDGWILQVPMPSGALIGYDETALPTVIDRWHKQRLRQVTAGFCLLCTGQLTAAIHADTDPLRVGYNCQQCGVTADLPIDMHFVDHPAVVAFFYTRGINVRTTPFWEFQQSSTDTATLLATDPPRAHVSFTVDGDELRLTVDDELNVLEVDE